MTQDPAGMKNKPSHRFFWAALVCFIVVFLYWNSPLLLPLKWLTVLFHELSHALVGWATGGRLESLNITHRESGICRVVGGNQTLFLMAGYPGSLCWGLAALYLARQGRWLNTILLILGVALGLVTLIYIRPILHFGFLFGLLSAIALGVLGYYGHALAQRFLIMLVGVASTLYVMLDIQADVFHFGGGVSDATLLARHTGIPAWIWGGVWYALALGRKRQARPAFLTNIRQKGD